MLTSLVLFIVWRLSCSEIASSNGCSEDFTSSLAEWAEPSRSSTWRHTVNTGFFTLCPGKKAIERTLLCTGNCKCCFCSQGSDKPPLNFCNFCVCMGSVCPSSIHSPNSPALSSCLLLQSCLLRQQTVDTASCTTPPLLPPTLLVSRD